MEEKYSGTKFKTIFLEKGYIDDLRIPELIKLGKNLAKYSFFPKYKGGSAGNMSFRTNKGFVITCSYTDISNLNRADFSEVIDCVREKKEVYIKGFKSPSSETFLHSAVYEKRKDVNAIVHGHSEILAKNADLLKIQKTKEEKPYGTIELADEVARTIGKNNLILIGGHGFLAVGKDLSEVRETILRKIKKI